MAEKKPVLFIMIAMKQNYLMIDDDVDLGHLLQQYVAQFDIDLTVAHHPVEGLELLLECPFEVLILDVMLPEMDGFEVCKRIRKTLDIPILMLTARGDLTDKVLGLELGCDDYLAKPFEPRELVARCQSLARRSQHRLTTNQNGGLQLDSQSMQVTWQDRTVDLTAMEADALQMLMQRRGEVVSRDELLNRLKGIDTEVFSRAIDILISRLRLKLKQLSDRQFIYTVRGKGYRYWDE